MCNLFNSVHSVIFHRFTVSKGDAEVNDQVALIETAEEPKSSCIHEQKTRW